MLDWLIIGGGIHGTHLSFVLTRRYGIPRGNLRVLDPHPAPLYQWDHFTGNTGMQFLRSPHVHNLHWDVGSLITFARIHETAPFTRFIPPFNRPSTELFRRHCDHIINRYDLADLRIQGTAQQLERTSDAWRVITEQGAIDSKNILLAIGMPEKLNYPAWTQQLRQRNAPVTHIFEPDFQLQTVTPPAHVVIIGGGISATQTALYFAEYTDSIVTLISRHEMRVHDFDSDPGWMNAINLRDYANIENPDERRNIINTVRHRGSIPPDVDRSLRAAIRAVAITRLETDVQRASYNGQRIALELHNGHSLNADLVLLATGFETQRPGGEWLNRVIHDYALPVAECGYPITDTTLKWADGLYVSGALAELEIGPVARNIIGARMTGERLRPLFN